MPFPWAAVIPAAISAAGSIFGQERANRTNVAEAATNRAFQREMRNTSWQAGIADMERAGVNPAVAFGRGGAAVPGGSVASVDDAVSGGVSSAMEATMLRKQIKLLDQQTKKVESEAGIAHSEHVIKRTEADMAGERWRYYFSENGSPKRPLLDLLDQQHAGSMASSARTISDAELSKLSIPERQAVARLFDQIGSGGKGVQMLGPLLLQLLRR